MAIDAVGHNPTVTSDIVGSGDAAGAAASGGANTTKKVDPNSSEVLTAAVEAFLPSMISNTLMLNNSLFNFAKEAIDEGDEG
ncbi:hypothetical protein [Ensifer aridi]|uniref:hypothetical protein n=1 Tax=Ensifer aridi TaxID=1708715 RepID=UPI0003FD928A|nr:hypothetical protein [Ensifer aridi]